MKRALVIAPIAVVAAFALAAGIAWPDDDVDDHDDTEMRQHFYGFDVLPLSQVADLVEARFQGKLIAARLVPPRPWERDRGVELIHELRLLTPRRDVLVFRLDARTGDFLDIAGTGLTQARREPADPPVTTPSAGAPPAGVPQ